MRGDTLRFLAKLTFPKILNLVQVRISYLVSILLRRPLVWGLPFFISIEPSAVCNLKCPQCPVGKGDIRRKNNFLDNVIYEGIIDQLHRSAITLNLNFQGEPLMNVNLPDWVRYAGNRGLYTITSTNGHNLTGEVPMKLVKSGLDRIIISVDGTDPETYTKYRRGGNFATVIDGIKTLSDARAIAGKNNPLIIIQFLVFKHNEHQVEQILKLGREWGADKVHIKSAQIEYFEDGKDWLPDEKNYKRYAETSDGALILKKNPQNRCRRIWETTVITSDAVVVPCCFDKKAQFPMGSLQNSDFRDIWENTAYREFREGVLRDRKKNPICMNCTEGQSSVYKQ